MERKIFNSYTSIILMVLFVALLVLMLINGQETLRIGRFLFSATVPFIFGFFIAYILNILVKYYEKILPKGEKLKALSRTVAILASMITVIAFFTIIAFLAIPQLIHSLTILVSAVPSLYKMTLSKINEYLTLMPSNYQQVLADQINETMANFDVKSFGNAVLSQIISSMRSLFHLMLNFVLGCIFAIFILINKERVCKQLHRLAKAFLKENHYNNVANVVKVSHETLSSYIVGQFLDATILGCMITMGMFICGLSYPVTIGCAVGLLSLIPLLGAYLGGLMGVIMLLPLGLNQAIIFLIILVVVQQIESNLIYPKVVGGSIGLPGIWTFLAITLGGSLYGILGMIISVPMAAIIYKLLKEAVDQRLKDKK